MTRVGGPRVVESPVVPWRRILGLPRPAIPLLHSVQRPLRRPPVAPGAAVRVGTRSFLDVGVGAGRLGEADDGSGRCAGIPAAGSAQRAAFLPGGNEEEDGGRESGKGGQVVGGRKRLELMEAESERKRKATRRGGARQRQGKRVPLPLCRVTLGWCRCAWPRAAAARLDSLAGCRPPLPALPGASSSFARFSFAVAEYAR